VDELRKQIESTRQRIEDQLDKPEDSAAGSLIAELKGLENDLIAGKNEYSIEHRIKEIIHILEGEAKDAQIMNYAQLDAYKDYFEHLRENFRH
jgi:hypothetical protein